MISDCADLKFLLNVVEPFRLYDYAMIGDYFPVSNGQRYRGGVVSSAIKKRPSAKDLLTRLPASFNPGLLVTESTHSNREPSNFQLPTSAASNS